MIEIGPDDWTEIVPPRQSFDSGTLFVEGADVYVTTENDVASRDAGTPVRAGDTVPMARRDSAFLNAGTGLYGRCRNNQDTATVRFVPGLFLAPNPRRTVESPGDSAGRSRAIQNDKKTYSVEANTGDQTGLSGAPGPYHVESVHFHLGDPEVDTHCVFEVYSGLADNLGIVHTAIVKAGTTHNFDPAITVDPDEGGEMRATPVNPTSSDLNATVGMNYWADSEVDL